MFYTKKLLYILFVLLTGASFVAASQIPNFYFEVPSEAIAPNSEFIVPLFLASEEPINALSVSFSYSSDILELVSLNTGSSIIDVWAHYPNIDTSGEVFFEGGISNAFTGEKGEIASFAFRVKRIGTAQVSVTKAYAYYADGLGTSVETEKPLVFVEARDKGTLLSLEGEDAEKPEFKEVFIEVNPIDKTPVVVFQVSDEGSGIKETQFRYRTGFLWSEWALAQNYVRIADETWIFQIKAIDNLGNVAVYTKYVPEAIPARLFAPVGVFALILAWMGIIFLRKRPLK